MSFLEVFSPGMQHLREERDRRKMLIVRPAYGGGGKPLGIDLEAGTATFARPEPKVDQTTEPASGSETDQTSQTSEADETSQTPEADETSHTSETDETSQTSETDDLVEPTER